MSLPDPDRLRAVLSATWPAAETIRSGPFILRRSEGGGRRVTAATALPGAEGLAAALPHAVAQMQAWGQVPLFQTTPETPELDALLDAAGYRVVDPTVILVAPLAAFDAIDTPRLSSFMHWPPLAIQREIWEDGGIGPDRVAVMARAPEPRLSLMARQGDKPVGTGFAAIHQGIVMVHAIEVRPDHRRQGIGARMMARAAGWAAGLGAAHLALAVTEDNHGARAFYASLGMVPAARYHYRVRA